MIKLYHNVTVSLKLNREKINFVFNIMPIRWNHRFLIVYMACVFVMTTACTPLSFSVTNRATPSASPQPFIVPSPTSAPVYRQLPSLSERPKTCTPSLSKVQNGHDNREPANALGGSNIWALGFSGPDATFTPVSQEPQGWVQKVLWIVGPEHPGPVVLQGKNLQNQQPLAFQVADGKPVIAAVLETNVGMHPSSFKGKGWREWGSYLFAPSIGCYTLTASWQGGSWTRIIAVGYPIK